VGGRIMASPDPEAATMTIIDPPTLAALGGSSDKLQTRRPSRRPWLWGVVGVQRLVNVVRERLRRAGDVDPIRI
jgi:hypothetical protein